MSTNALIYRPRHQRPSRERHGPGRPDLEHPRGVVEEDGVVRERVRDLRAPQQPAPPARRRLAPHELEDQQQRAAPPSAGGVRAGKRAHLSSLATFRRRLRGAAAHRPCMVSRTSSSTPAARRARRAHSSRFRRTC
jgi:hypothetical protein